MSAEKYSVLIADDSDDDRFFLRRAIATAAPRLHVVGELHNGDEIVAYLTGSGAYANRQQYPFPNLLLMDWRMPRKDGFEVLAWLQENPFPDLKVAVLADSSGTTYRSKAIDMGAAWFFSKLVGNGELIHTVKMLQDELVQGGRKNG
ncbi:MAG: response regulator receiver protein [Pedosphaera sp.]|nr:response regulator receiver protein [Pedosphaera sp.]